MIQYKKGTSGLDKLITQYTEYNKSSIFDVVFPNFLGVGKNEIRIAVGSNKLATNSEIFIDIFDVNRNPIYFEVSKIANDDLTRSIIVFIYPDTPSGKCTFYISGTTISGNVYLFSTNLICSSEVNDQPIKFQDFPKIIYKERLQPIQLFSQQRILQQITSTGSQSVSIISRISPKNIDRNDVLSTEVPEIPKIFRTNAKNNNVGTSSFEEIPKFVENSVLTSANFAFSSSMVGGTIFLNGISLEIPNDSSETSQFLNHQFSSSILKLISTSSIEVSPAFNKTIQYRTNDGIQKTVNFDRIFNLRNFTASFYDIESLTTSEVTQSYVCLDMFGIEPIVGSLRNIRLSYKPMSVFGNDFQPIGEFKVDGFNFLSSTSSVYFDTELGLIESPIGIFRNGLSDFQTNWVTQSFGTGSLVVTNSSLVGEGIRISYPSTRSLTEYHYFTPRENRVFAFENTQFELSLNTFGETDFSRSFSQMDIYISGSVKRVDYNTENVQLELKSSASFGTYIGSVTAGRKESKFRFITDKSGYVQPFFVIQSGIWNFGNIKLSSISEPGFSTNQTRIYAPLNDVITGTELSIKIEYLNNSGIPSKHQTIIDKVYFTGFDDNTPIITSKLQQSHESSSRVQYLVSKAGTITNNPTNVILMSAPVFVTDLDSVTPITGSSSAASFAYTVQTMFFGYTGSISNPIDTYTWAGTVQGRALVNKFDNSGIPLLFTPVALTGSNYYTQGTFGPGGSSPSKPDLDSWMKFLVAYWDSTGNLNIRYRMVGSSSFNWDVQCVSNFEVIKYETRY